MSSSGTLSLDGNSPLFCSSGEPPSPDRYLSSNATGCPMLLGEAPVYKAFLGRPAAINPEFDRRQLDNSFPYDGDQSDSGSSTMSGPSTNPGHQLATSGFEPIVPQNTHLELERIEVRLRELEEEEERRNGARTSVLLVRRDHDAFIAAKRKREDDEFREITERAEAEEVELRRKRRRMKRESMGLFVFSPKNSPETETSPMTAPVEPQKQGMVTLRYQPNSQPNSQPDSAIPSPFPTEAPRPSLYNSATHRKFPERIIPRKRSPPATPATSARRGGRPYTIKDRVGYDNRHGPADRIDREGRGVWTRPSDGVPVNIVCPFQDCRKSDYRTVHGFTIHMTRFHKDKTSRGHYQVLEIFGVPVADTNPPQPSQPGHPGADNPLPSSNTSARENIQNGSSFTPANRTQGHPPLTIQPPAQNDSQSTPQSGTESTTHSFPPINAQSPFQNGHQTNSTHNATENSSTQSYPSRKTHSPQNQSNTEKPTLSALPNRTSQPIPNQNQGETDGYHQTDILYSDSSDSEEDDDTPQIKIEKGLPDEDETEDFPAGPKFSKKVDKDADEQLREAEDKEALPDAE
ncbi:hypothetical protein FQN54_002825 [Arachnomyces sp. PD_36]|nr:hypothetical protein FQN54_002825 [Arachnomyces sp. PD_36]